ncbi:glutaredoxin family protein [Bacteroidota bacterium]
MDTINVKSLEDLSTRLGKEKRSFLLIWKKGSELSDRAYQNLRAAAVNTNDIGIFTCDVNRVRDIHPAFLISSAPALLEFAGEEFKNTYKGAHDSIYYKALFDNAVYVAKAEKEGRKIKQVTVYSTPTCSWCTTLKSYLNKNNISYTDIDVSKNEAASQEMVRRSGQQGVPQTLIGGEMIVGFDKPKINRLLHIQG